MGSKKPATILNDSDSEDGDPAASEARALNYLNNLKKGHKMDTKHDDAGVQRPPSPSLLLNPPPQDSKPSIVRRVPSSHSEKKRSATQTYPTHKKRGLQPVSETARAARTNPPELENPHLVPSDKTVQLTTPSLEEKVEILTAHVLRQEEWLETIIAQNQVLTDSVKHLCKELATVHQKESLCEIPPSPAFDALALMAPPIPDLNDTDLRPMQMREREQLARAIQRCNNDTRCVGLIRIAEPDAIPNKAVTIRISEYEPKKLWKLWHYVVMGKELRDVLTSEERAASDPKRFANPDKEKSQRPLMGPFEQSRLLLQSQLTQVELQGVELAIQASEEAEITRFVDAKTAHASTASQ